MKIALINGSPKAKNSGSEYIIHTLKSLLPKENEIIECNLRTAKLSNEELEHIVQCNVLVFAFPLYFDGIPSHLVDCLYQIETYLKTKLIHKITVYSIVNCGFYEGQQNSIALEIMKNWCEKAKINWGQGLGIGGGGMLPMFASIPEGKGPKKNFSEAIKTIANSIYTCTTGDNIYISPNFPRVIYKLAAEMGWRQQIKANGLKKRDLFTKKS